MTNGPTRALVAIDLSPRADDALRKGAQLASEADGVLGVARVVRPGERAAQEQVIREHVAKVIPGFEKLEVFVDEGSDAAATLADRARVWNASVLVLGARRHGLLGHVLRGVAEKIVQNAPCAVLVVHPAPETGGVIAATDLLKPQLPAVVAGSEEAERRHTHLRVVHAVGFFDAEARYLVASSDQVMTSSDFESFTKELEEAVDEVGVDGACQVISGSPARAIVQEAEASHAQLIVLAKRERPGRPILRGVAEDVVRRAPCSVLVVPVPTSPPAVRAAS